MNPDEGFLARSLISKNYTQHLLLGLFMFTAAFKMETIFTCGSACLISVSVLRAKMVKSSGV